MSFFSVLEKLLKPMRPYLGHRNIQNSTPTRPWRLDRARIVTVVGELVAAAKHVAFALNGKGEPADKPA